MSPSNELISNSGSEAPLTGLPVLPRCPSQLGKYVLRRELGRGGMGIVYEGEDTLLERAVAIKWLIPQSAEPLAIDRLLREARWAARLNHPNVVAVYDAGEHPGGVYIALELVRGHSAYEHVHKRGPFNWRDATRIVAEVCQGLAAAHAAGLIHRDIKPANILLVDAARPEKALTQADCETVATQAWAKLSDFGLSRSLNYTAPATVEGKVVGTPHYMSPEQIRGEQLDQRTDLYSLGATYFTLLTGKLPYEREDVIQVLFAHCSAAVPDPRAIDETLPSACSAIIARCLAKEPRERYASATELLMELRSLPAGEAAANVDFTLTQAPKSALGRTVQRPLVAVSAIALCCILLVFAWSRLPPNSSQPSTMRGSGSSNPADKPSRPALPMEGVTVETAWTDKQDGTLLTAGEMEFMRLAADGRTLAWGVSEGEPNSGRLTLFDIERQEVVGMFVDERRYAAFNAVTFPSEQFVLLACSSQVIAIDRNTNQPTTLIELSDGSARSIEVAPDGRRLAHGVVEWDGGGRVELYDLAFDADGPRIKQRGAANREHQRPVKCVTFSRDGRYVASASEDGVVIVGDGFTGETVKQLALPPQADPAELGYALQFSPDSRWLAAGGHRGVALWDVNTFEQRILPEKHQRGIMAIAFSQNGQFVASGSTDGIRIWNVEAGWQAGDTLNGHDGNVITGLAFAKNDSVLITAGFDQRVHFVNLGRLKRSASE